MGIRSFIMGMFYLQVVLQGWGGGVGSFILLGVETFRRFGVFLEYKFFQELRKLWELVLQLRLYFVVGSLLEGGKFRNFCFRDFLGIWRYLCFQKGRFIIEIGFESSKVRFFLRFYRVFVRILLGKYDYFSFCFLINRFDFLGLQKK